MPFLICCSKLYKLFYIWYSFCFQYYDVSDITINAAKQLADFIATKQSTVNHADIHRKANSIANDALHQDEGLLAVALAAPLMKIAVVQFRSHVDNTTNRNSLTIYWRELGEAWNRSEGTQSWGTPFRDCGPMQGRWLWPFSATILSSGYKWAYTIYCSSNS